MLGQALNLFNHHLGSETLPRDQEAFDKLGDRTLTTGVDDGT